MKIKITCGNTCFEWYEWKEKEIDTDLYDFFKIDYRVNSWHIIGYSYDKKTDKWKSKELSDCEVSYLSLIDFLKIVDKPISEYHNTHCYKGFNEILVKLLKEVVE